jgi:hypothetical protein
MMSIHPLQQTAAASLVSLSSRFSAAAAAELAVRRREDCPDVTGVVMASKAVSSCKRDPRRLGVLAECRKSSGPTDNAEEWPSQFLSTGTIAFSCGMLARQGDGALHAHDAEELKRCRRLAAEAAAIMTGVLIGGNDESDHTLDAFWVPANVGDPVPKRITEAAFRKAMRGTVYPGAQLTIEPFKKTSDWWKRVSVLHPDYDVVPEDFPNEPERVAKWNRLLLWFCNHADLHSPVYIGFKEPTQGEFHATVFPKLFVALTASGSLVGLATCVVWT